MRRPGVYSHSPRTLPPAADDAADQADAPASPEAAGEGRVATPPPAKARWQPGRGSFASLVVLCAALVTGTALWAPRPGGKALTQKDIDAAVLRTLQTNTLPSPAAKAADIIRPSVVRVVSYGEEKNTPEAKTQKRGRNMAKGKPPEAPNDGGPAGEVERGVGTGVVIVDKGVILTNLHVVAGATRSRSPSSTAWRPWPPSPACSPRTTLPCCRPRRCPMT